MKLYAGVLGLVLIVSSTVQLYQASRASDSAPQTPKDVVKSAERAVVVDASNAFAWCALAEALADADEAGRARECFRRAVKLAPNVPVVWMRAANFHFAQGETDETLRASSRALAFVSDYDGIVFSYWDRLVPEVRPALPHLAGNERAARAYLQHQISAANEAGAETVWNWLVENKTANDEVAARYVDFLLRQRQGVRAAAAWAAQLGDRRGDYLRNNHLFNGGFESDPLGSSMDWKITPAAGVEVSPDETASRQGRRSLHLDFKGEANISYGHVYQMAYVRPGPYVFRAAVRTDSLTTNEGLRFRIFDPSAPARLDVTTDSINGTNEWMTVERGFSVPAQTSVVRVQVVRRPSAKFDNKIHGGAWIDSVELLPR